MPGDSPVIARRRLARSTPFAPCICLAASLLQASPIPVSPKSLCFSVSGGASAGPRLRKQDLSLEENGLPQKIQQLWKSPQDLGLAPSDLDRVFVVYFDPDLDLHEIFRVRRWLLGMLPHFRETDSLAVYRFGALSPLVKRQPEMRHLVQYFGSGVLQGFSLQRLFSPAVPRPDLFTLDRPPHTMSPDEVARVVSSEGAVGDLLAVLGALQEAPGRKILLYFGKSSIPTYHKFDLGKDATARLLADSGVTLFAFCPSETPAREILQKLARRSGGELVGPLESLREKGQELLETTSNYYCLSYTPSIPPDGTFRRIQLSAGGKGLTIRHPEGYFATVSGAHGALGKTFLTVLENPVGYHDFPFGLSFTPSRARDVSGSVPVMRMKVTIPLSPLGMHGQKESGGGDAANSQVLHLLALTFDEGDTLTGVLSRQYLLQMNPPRAGKESPTYGFFEEELHIKPSTIRRVLVILISGLNEKIATRAQEL